VAAAGSGGLTVLERVVVDGGGVWGERGGEHYHRGPARVRGNPSRTGVKLQDDELGLRGGRVRGRRRGIWGLPCWAKAPSMEAGSGKETDVSVTAALARRTAYRGARGRIWWPPTGPGDERRLCGEP